MTCKASKSDPNLAKLVNAHTASSPAWLFNTCPAPWALLWEKIEGRYGDLCAPHKIYPWEWISSSTFNLLSMTQSRSLSRSSALQKFLVLFTKIYEYIIPLDTILTLAWTSCWKQWILQTMYTTSSVHTSHEPCQSPRTTEPPALLGPRASWP